MTLHVSHPDQVRIQTLCTALNVCVAQLRLMQQSGEVPPADSYRHGRYSYWKLATIRAWRPKVADAIELIHRAVALAQAA